MPCPSTEILQNLVLTGEVQDPQALEKHLSRCVTCQQTLQQLELVSQPLDPLGLKRKQDREANDPLIGQTFGKYTLLTQISSGGSGKVYKAVQTTTERVVAVKLLPTNRFSDESLRAWTREARLAGRINHPHVVQILDADEAGGYRYCVFEWVQGGDLGQRLRQSELEPRIAALYARDIAAGCTAIHACNILHRDIKPSNVLVDRQGKVKLADFGIARCLDETITTLEGYLVGTPGYMSPEQLGLVEDKLSPATDVYGIGALLYAMLVGRSPFIGSNPVEILANAREEVLPPSTFRLVPRNLEIICMKCLEREPAARYVSAEELHDDLNRFLNGEPVQARPPSLITRVRRQIRLHRRLAAALILAAACGVFFLAGLVWANEAEQRRRAELRLAEIMRADVSDLPALFDQFHQFSPRYRTSALAALAPTHRAAADQARRKVRIALAEKPPSDEVLETALDELEHLPAPEFLPVVRHFEVDGQNPSPAAITGIDRALQSATNNATRLKAWGLHACTAPDTLDGEQLRQIVVLLSDNGDLDASVWLGCFPPIASPLAEAIVELLRDEDLHLHRDALVSYAVRLIQRADSPNLRLLAEALVFASPSRLVSLAGELTVQESRQVAEHLAATYRNAPATDRARGLSAKLPEHLQQLQPWSDRYHGIYCQRVLLLAGIPQHEWPQLDALAVQAGLSLINFRPCRIGTEVLIAATFAEDSPDGPTQVTIDAPEADVLELADRKRQEGRFPLSIWARPAEPGQLDSLLVSVVWRQLKTPVAIAFDQSPQQLGFQLNAERDEYQNTNRFWTQHLGMTEDLEATASSAKNQRLERLEINPLYTFRRSVSLIRATGNWDASRDVETGRLQYVADELLPQDQIRVLQRNFQFTSRPRKLQVAATLSVVHRLQADILCRIGFSPESVSISQSPDGQLLLASRWSAALAGNPARQDGQVSAAVFAAFLLGDSQPMLDAFDAKLDRTLATRLASYGAQLDSRHAVLVRDLLGRAQSPEARYSIALLASYMPATAIDPPLRDALLALRRETSEASYLSATKFLDREQDPAAVLARKQPPTPTHLQRLEPEVGGAMVVIDVRDQPTFIGGERLLPWEGKANQQFKLLEHSFAIALHEVTFAEFQAYRRATGLPETSLPETCPSPDCPIVGVPYFEILRYCRWLSEQNGIPEDELVLPPSEQIGQGMLVDRNLVESYEYRLPTWDEMEIAVRAGTITDRFLGRSDTLLQDYANIASLSQQTLLSVGSLRPNPYGLFDCYGNALDLCLHYRHGTTDFPNHPRERRLQILQETSGGSFLTHGMYASAAGRLNILEANIEGDLQIGFRIARTLALPK